MFEENSELIEAVEHKPSLNESDLRSCLRYAWQRTTSLFNAFSCALFFEDLLILSLQSFLDQYSSLIREKIVKNIRDISWKLVYFADSPLHKLEDSFIEEVIEKNPDFFLFSSQQP